MSQSGIDPFNRMGAYARAPSTQSMFDKTPSRINRPYVQETVIVENLTTVNIATYSGIGVRTILPFYNKRPENVVRVELTITIPKSATFDFLAIDSLMVQLSHEQRQQVLTFFDALDKDDYLIRNSVTFNLHWDVPMELLKRSPHGVLIEGINQVIQIHHPDTDRTELFPAFYQPPPLGFEPTEGLTGTFNKHDNVVRGIWVNIKGTIPIQICSNLNDTSLPEGFSVLMNGKWCHLGIDQLAFHGFYLTPMQATAAHSLTTAEQTTAHKQWLIDQEKMVDREEKRADKEYDRTEKKASQEYDRTFKEEDRIDKRTDKVYDREQALIDKAPLRKQSLWNARATPFLVAITVGTAVMRGILEFKKFYDTLAEK